MDGNSIDIIQQRLKELAQIIPECLTEGKIDWEKMRVFFGELCEFKNERYHLNWAGKSDCYRLLQTPTYKTLKPCWDESISFDSTENVFIEGENLEVLKTLQKAYFGKIKMIYIDPPYNTGNDFVYKDDYSQPLAEYRKRVGDLDANGNVTKSGLLRNTKESGHYHSNWLNMMLPRLFLARNLLRNDGVIFVSIDDNEVHNLRLLMDEIFGEENFVGMIINKSNPRGSQETYGISVEHEYILCYTKTNTGFFSITGKERDENDSEFPFITNDGKTARLLGLRKRGGDWKKIDRPNMYYPFFVNPETSKIALEEKENYTFVVYPVRPDGEESRWTWSKETAKINIDKLIAKKIKRNNQEVYDIYRIDYLENETGEKKREKLKSVWEDKTLNYQNARQYFKNLFGNSELFDFPKPPELIKKLLLSLNSKNDLILDFFGGSGTTAHAVMELNKEDGGNRKWILVQMPEPTDIDSEAYKSGYKTIADIAKERIRRVSKKIQDEIEVERIKKEGELEFENQQINTIDLGFKVFKLDESNFKQWQPFVPEKADQIKHTLFEFVDHLKPDANTENILYELMLKNGKMLTEKIEKINQFWVIGEKELILLLENIDQSLIDEVLKLKPHKALALDKLFNGNDQLKTNTVLQFKDAGIEFKCV